MLVNLTLRVLGNGHVFIQYQEDGKAKDAGFVGWAEFIVWLKQKVEEDGGKKE